jgi:hypothetical protein
MSAREIAGISFGRSRRGILVNLRVYFDGGGKEENDPVITVGGFLADADLCEKIEKDWEDATGGKIFHFTDFATESCQLGSGDWTHPQRTDFLKRLASIVNRPGCIIISVSIEVDAFFAHLRSPSISTGNWASLFGMCLYSNRPRRGVSFEGWEAWTSCALYIREGGP